MRGRRATPSVRGTAKIRVRTDAVANVAVAARGELARSEQATMGGSTIMINTTSDRAGGIRMSSDHVRLSMGVGQASQQQSN